MKFCNCVDISSNSNDYNVFLDDVTYELETRNKTEWLNHDQIMYLKSCLTDCNYKVKKFAVEYNLSQSVLNKIKRNIFE